MADGMDCTCAAWSENECCCGADWTTQEMYDLRSCVEELERQRDELKAAAQAFADWYDERSGDNECRPLENLRAAITKGEKNAQA